MPRQIQRRSDCPISYALDIFGDKWSLLIVRDLMFKEKTYYTEFLHSEEKISTNILADRLERLETQGLVSKKQDLDHLSRYQYQLTTKGLDLLPVLLEIIGWSAKYDQNTAASKRFVTRLKKDRNAITKEIRSTHKL